MTRRAFTLIEVLVWLALLTTAALIADRVFRTMFRLSREANRSLNETSRTDQAVRGLRADAWHAWRILQRDNEKVELSVDDGEVTWRLEADGSLTRQVFPGDTTPDRWPSTGVTGFSPHPAGILL